MGEAQFSTIVGDPGIGLTDVHYTGKQAQKGRTTRESSESYAHDALP